MTDIWPVYSGKSFAIWNPDTKTYYDSVDADSIMQHLQNKRLSQRNTKTSAFAEQDQSLTDDLSTLPCLHPRIAFKNVVSADNARTVVVALIPPCRVITHAAPYLLRIRGNLQDEAFLLGILTSMICDWQARRTVQLNLTFAHFNSLRVPDPGPNNPIRKRVVEIAGRLAAVDERFAEWAQEVGVEVGTANEDSVKTELIHELDACVALLYGLDDDDLECIYTTFHEREPERYRDRLNDVLKYCRKWRERHPDAVYQHNDLSDSHEPATTGATFDNSDKDNEL